MLELLDLWRLTDDELRRLSPTLALYMPPLSLEERHRRAYLRAMLEEAAPRRLVLVGSDAALIRAPRGQLETLAIVQGVVDLSVLTHFVVYGPLSTGGFFVPDDVRFRVPAGRVTKFLAGWMGYPIGRRARYFVTKADAALYVIGSAR